MDISEEGCQTRPLAPDNRGGGDDDQDDGHRRGKADGGAYKPQVLKSVEDPREDCVWRIDRKLSR
jgi:hypothetical protein